MFNWFSNFRKNKNKQVYVPPVEETPQKSAKEIELETHLGNLVICVSNEVENPMVGVGKEIIYLSRAKQPFLVVQDLVTNEEVTPFGTIYSYTEQKFNALNDMDPCGRIAILYNRLEDEEIKKTPSHKNICLPAKEWKEKVSEAIAKWEASKTSVAN